MFVWWAAKGGVGTSVCAAGFALARADAGDEVLLVDLDGDQPAVLGVEASGDGVGEWCRADETVPVDALGELEVAVTDGLRLLPRGAGLLVPDRLALLAGVLGSGRRTVVIDGASRGEPEWIPPTAHPVVVTRCCYLALRRTGRLDPTTRLVVVSDGGRALRPGDVEQAVGRPIAARIAWDPAVARAVDAGLLATRLPRPLRALGLLGDPT